MCYGNILERAFPLMHQDNKSDDDSFFLLESTSKIETLTCTQSPVHFIERK